MYVCIWAQGVALGTARQVSHISHPQEGQTGPSAPWLPAQDGRRTMDPFKVTVGLPLLTGIQGQ